MRFSVCLLTGMMILASVGLLAQNGAKEKMVEEMLELSGTPDTLKQVCEEIMRMQANAINQQASIPAEQKEKVRAFQKKVMAKVVDFISWEKMKNDYIKLYADVYTEEELKALIEFLKSPAGQKMVKKNPQLMQKTMVLMQQKMQQLIPELEKMGNDFAEEMKGFNEAKKEDKPSTLAEVKADNKK